MAMLRWIVERDAVTAALGCVKKPFIDVVR
jgi:hypothetical protein